MKPKCTYHLAHLVPALLASAFLASCAQPVAVAPGTAARVMKIGGEGYIIEQLTAGTWTATPQMPTTTAAKPGQQVLLQKAIEDTSGCKVSGGDFSQGGSQFAAQVRCPGQKD